MTAAIKVENLSKAYQIGQIGTGTISRDLERWWVTRVMGREDPFLKLGETNDRAVKGKSDIVWSLKDIDFEIQQGDAVGIIGRNGAGKSTLLKLLSRVTAPTTGTIKIRGRVASLLEVGTGFHPELSGRENIYLNGSILGMRKKEIDRKLDEIVDFSGVERYIDTPVKRYSTGMSVRLAFAVAAHLESEILVIDEVLAVGDAEFQTKCLGKMGDVNNKEGRTVLFVSHNIGSIQRLCAKGILLNNGKLNASGQINDVIETYRATQNAETGKASEKNGFIQLLAEIKVFSNVQLTKDKKFDFDRPINVEVDFISRTKEEPVLEFLLINSKNVVVLASKVEDVAANQKIEPGRNKYLIKLPAGILKPDEYYFRFKWRSRSHGKTFLEAESKPCLILPPVAAGDLSKRQSVITPLLCWEKPGS